MKLILLFTTILSLILFTRVFFYFQNEKKYKAGDFFEEKILLFQEPRVQFNKLIIRTHNLRIEASIESDFHYGDNLFITGDIEEESFAGSNNKEVSLLVIKSPEIKKIKTNNPLIISTSFIRKRVWEVFLRTIPRPEAGLLYGIIFGGTQGFSSELKESFRSTGVLHVVAASGANVTLVSGFLFAFTSRLLKRKLAIGVSIIGIFYYALLAGFEPSIIRASIMAGIAFSAGILGRQNHAFLTLLFTAFIMCMINPGIIKDAGFLLSFSSTVGIVGFKNFLDSFKIALKTRGISDDITTTISAQIGSLPFMGAFFSSYSLVSLIVNSLVLWTIPILMILGGIAAICSITIPFIAFIPIYVALPLLWYFEKMVILFSNIPLLRFGNVPWILWIGYYLILFAIILKINIKPKK